MPSPLPFHPGFSSTWRRSSRSSSGRGWRSTSNTRWLMKQSLSVLDRLSPLSRYLSVRTRRDRVNPSRDCGGGGSEHHAHLHLTAAIQSDPACWCIIVLFFCVCFQALEAVNTQLRELYPESEELFDVVLITNNHANVGLRLINTINHYQLFIERFCMTGGNSPIGYLKAYHTNLYLSADPDKVHEALEAGIAAATMFTPDKMTEVSETQLRVAFDGDAVLFSDESEQIYKAHGLDKFFEHEKAHENRPLDHGPLKGFLEVLGKLQKKFYAKGRRMDCPIRTYLVTARSAASSGTRALKTLRSWGLEIDEALFLAGAPKGPMLEKIRPHIFFDDQMFHVEGAAEMGTVACHVPYGIAQRVARKGGKDKETSPVVK
ncbi:Cytosolic 5'-nucleotidase 1A [Oryzias melastigma]|uniref:Cytosolic 5'-nucleotidase 1A n=1 Tax=Oryzias melastigma TaxID=30732 RepID=A0A834BVB0_ORYME|nr:Cytosolic 5'-nucleotidase 1A [Oryzias melastigma]